MSGEGHPACAALALGAGRTVEPSEALEARLQQLHAQARASWPQVEVPPQRFFQALGENLPGGQWEEALERIQSGDLFLAVGCRLQLPSALEAFEQHILQRATRVLSRLVPSADSAAEVAQRVREHLFVGTATHRPRIEDYRGVGSLLGWTRAAVLRTGLNQLRGEPVEISDPEALEAALTPYPDPELLLRESGSRLAFGEAFAAALRTLTPRQRTLLRMHHLDRVPSEKLAALYGTHRVTVSRWLVAARRQLLATTRELLSTRLQLSEDELDSLLRVTRLGMETSLARYLSA